MPRGPRCCPAGYTFHVLNRGVARLTLFEKPEDYDAFECVLAEAHEREPLPIFAYTVMPNHWHFVVRPQTNTQVSNFFRWLTHTHSMRWHAHYGTSGTGHLYQGRFKAFPVQDDEHLYAMLRYVERKKHGKIPRALAFPSEARHAVGRWQTSATNDPAQIPSLGRVH